MDPNIPVYFILIIAIDILIVVMLVAVFLRNGSFKNNLKTSDLQQIKSLKSSFEKVMLDSENLSNKFMQAVDERIRALNEVHQKLYAKEKRLESNFLHAETLIKSINEKMQKSGLDHSDPYKKAADLISQGFASKDVQKLSGLSLSEIDLIKQLARHKIQ